MDRLMQNTHRVNLSQAERWFSLVAGGAVAVWGIKRRSPIGVAAAIAGGEMIRRGATGRCYLYQSLGVRTAPLGQGAETTSVPYQLGIRVDRVVTVAKPRAELFAFWRNLANLPRFMRHVKSITVLDGKRSHWVAKAPAGRTVEWDAEIIDEEENEHIGWRSLPGSVVAHAGSVWFKDAAGGRGTVVSVELQYNPPGGVWGALLARLWGEEPGQQIQEDLNIFKQIMETGESATVEGQTSGRAAERAGARTDEVTAASEESFPASDAPALSPEGSFL